MELNRQEIGKRIMRIRKEHDFTQEYLAEQLNISKNHLSGIECGKYTVTTAFIFKLCTIFQKTPDYFLIGQITTVTDELTTMIRGLSDTEQKMILELVKTYTQVKTTSIVR